MEGKIEVFIVKTFSFELDQRPYLILCHLCLYDAEHVTWPRFLSWVFSCYVLLFLSFWLKSWVWYKEVLNTHSFSTHCAIIREKIVNMKSGPLCLVTKSACTSDHGLSLCLKFCFVEKGKWHGPMSDTYWEDKLMFGKHSAIIMLNITEVLKKVIQKQDLKIVPQTKP